MPMKTILLLSENWEVFDPRDLSNMIEAAKIAEEAGIDAVMVSEHIVLGPAAGAGKPKRNPRQFDMPGNQPSDTAHPSSIVMLGALAAATSRVDIIAGAILPVLRHPLQIAKDLATVDLLSKGRLIVLPTVSWHDEEYAALGVDFTKRGKMLDEQLAIWRLVWSETPASYHGEFYSFDDVYVVPKPWRPEGPRLWITGDHLHKAALRRAVTYGAGFAAVGPIPAEERDTLFEALKAAGRDPSTFSLMGGIMGDLKPGNEPADIDATFEQLPFQREFGATAIVAKPSQYIKHIDELPDFCRRFVERVKQIG
jgi:probable F420-dependent oxidoreductase